MTRSRRSARPLVRNTIASLVATAAFGVIHLNADPMEVGGSPLAKASTLLPPMIQIPSIPLAPPMQLDDMGELDQGVVEGSPAPVVKRNVALDDPTVLRGIWAMKFATALLDQGRQSFSQVSDYTATMFKQERIGGVLGEGQTIELKMRHEPFSVYMKWNSGDRGRQAIYVEGLNEGAVLVQPGGIKGRLTGVIKLDPNGSLALSEARHPITEAGLVELARILLDSHKADIQRGHGFECELRDDQLFNDRPCYMLTCVYEKPEFNATYRKSVIFVDKEFSMPVCVKNYTWARDANPETIDDETLIEFYAYTDVRVSQQLGAADFDQNNKSYKLRVKR